MRMKNIPYTVWSTQTPNLTKEKSPVSEGEDHHVKNEDEIDESHKSQLKFEYEVCLLNYTIKIKNPQKTTLGF